MIYAILSDVHANASALKAVLKDAGDQGATEFICLGDTVGYGPEPEQSIDLIRTTCSQVLRGNHDTAVAGLTPTDDYIDLAAESITRHKSTLSNAEKAWLKQLPATCRFECVRATHADFTAPDDFLYIESAEDAQSNFLATHEQLLFFGHTHSPALFVQDTDGRVAQLPPQDFLLEDGKRYLINPGSVGYPREADGKCLSSYILFDAESRTIRFRYLVFSVSSVMERGIRKPMNHHLLWLSLIVLPLLVFGGVLATRSCTREESATPAAIQASQLVLKTATCETPIGIHFVRGNIKLSRNSAQVLVTVKFQNEQGQTLGAPMMHTVKQSFSKKLKVPNNSSLAIFTVSKLKAEDAIELLSFAPTAER